MNAYEEKKQKRIERYRERAKKAAEESAAFTEQSSELAKNAFPFGQPILIGHHSEGRARAAQKRIHRLADKSLEAHNEAKYYESKADAAESNAVISSDDPDAIAKLKLELEGLEKKRDMAKETNKAWRKFNKTGDRKSLYELDLSDSFIDETQNKLAQFYDKLPFPRCTMTNLGAKIRRLQKRIGQLQKVRSQETSTYKINETEVVYNTEANRVQILYPCKPSAELRQKLKSNGFRWSPRNQAWQRHLSDYALHLAKSFAEEAL